MCLPLRNRQIYILVIQVYPFKSSIESELILDFTFPARINTRHFNGRANHMQPYFWSEWPRYVASNEKHHLPPYRLMLPQSLGDDLSTLCDPFRVWSIILKHNKLPNYNKYHISMLNSSEWESLQYISFKGLRSYKILSCIVHIVSTCFMHFHAQMQPPAMLLRMPMPSSLERPSLKVAWLQQHLRLKLSKFRSNIYLNIEYRPVHSSMLHFKFQACFGGLRA